MMKFLGLDGKTYSADVRQNQYPMRTEAACKSKIQYRCGQILKEAFPMVPILEEFILPKHRLAFDFFLPTLGIALEVHGRQHDEFVPFFHGTKKNFASGQQRDQNKEMLCEINSWKLYIVRSEDELHAIIGSNNGSTTKK